MGDCNRKNKQKTMLSPTQELGMRSSVKLRNDRGALMSITKKNFGQSLFSHSEETGGVLSQLGRRKSRGPQKGGGLIG